MLKKIAHERVISLVRLGQELGNDDSYAINTLGYTRNDLILARLLARHPIEVYDGCYTFAEAKKISCMLHDENMAKLHKSSVVGLSEEELKAKQARDTRENADENAYRAIREL